MFFDSEKGRNDTGARIQGHVTLVSAALLAGVLRDGNLSCQGKKDLHKVSGAAWATFVGHEGYSMYKVGEGGGVAPCAAQHTLLAFEACLWQQYAQVNMASIHSAYTYAP